MSHEMTKKLLAEQLAMPLQSAIGALMEQVHEGLRHGHFKMGITCEVVNACRQPTAAKCPVKSLYFVAMLFAWLIIDLSDWIST
jgi:hypothetical protein